MAVCRILLTPAEDADFRETNGASGARVLVALESAYEGMFPKSRSPRSVGTMLSERARPFMHFMRAGRDGTQDDAYDIEVVDEAVVNAVAHRDYSVSGSQNRLWGGPTLLDSPRAK